MENPYDWSRLQCAIDIAHEAHAGRSDKAGEPYIYHVLRVGMSLLPDVDAAVAGVLHDVIEDSKVVPASLAQFGERVVYAVIALTRKPGQPYERYIAQTKANKLARKVKLADLEDNMDPERHGRALSYGADTNKMKALQARYSKAIIDLETGPL